MKYLASILFAVLACLPASAQDLLVWPGIVENVETGERTQTGKKNALAHALMISESGDLIEINGNLGHINLCLGEAYRKNDVVREAPINVTIRGGSRSHSVIRGLSLSAKGGGYEVLRLRNLTIDARGSQVGILGYMDQELGRLDLEGVTLLSDYKTKWGYRIHGWSHSLRFVDITGNGGGQEHLIYVDHTRRGIEIDGVVGRNWNRTLVQVVCREQPGSPGITRPAPAGDLLIANGQAYDCGRDGGSNFTIAGWPAATVTFRDNYGQSKWETGLFVAYEDFKQGSLLDPEGFGISHLVWAHNTGIFSNGSRAVNMLGGIGYLEMRVGDINAAFTHSPNRGMEFDHNGQTIGLVELQSRVDPNLWNIQCPKRFVSDNDTLTDDEVRALWVQ